MINLDCVGRCLLSLLTSAESDENSLPTYKISRISSGLGEGWAQLVAYSQASAVPLETNHNMPWLYMMRSIILFFF